MRIIAGSLKGRIFEAPHGHRTHPMSEKIRGAIFNALGDIEGLYILDCFAGSGAISFEAISRGAISALAIDIDKRANRTMKLNANKLGIESQIKIIEADCKAWSRNNPAQRFDIVVLDPPYDDVDSRLLQLMTAHTRNKGILICSLPPTVDFFIPSGFKQLSSKNYGDAKLEFYRRLN
jgi:16S rRNA (guanine966-N2)-methyltransferase